MKERKFLIELLYANIIKKLSDIGTRISNQYVKFKDDLEQKLYQSNKIDLEDLAPVNQVENGEEYFKAMDWALKNKNVFNIALSGPYGSGKSSVIRSYIKKHPSMKAINISLASFIEVKENENGEIQHSLVDLGGEERIEEGILKQLFYKVNYKKIPQSRYRKLHNINGIKVYINLLLLTLFASAAVSFFSPNIFSGFVSIITKTGGIMKISNNFSFAIAIFIILIIIGIIAYLFWRFSSKYRVKELNLSDKASVEARDTDAESIFNKNMDEIVYFFEATNFDTVFIEDLDRFKSTKIFVKLRELNAILNNYEMIKRRIVFVYAIKDDMFISAERTKFFDVIIPVVPIINSTNSGEVLLKKLEKEPKDESKKVEYKYNIRPEFVTQISPYIDDMRLLTNIYNEFVIYKNTLGTNQELKLIDEQMMSYIIFKNIFPKDFADLQMEKGIVKQVFKDKREFVKIQLDSYDQKIRSIESDLENINKDVLADIRELKVVLMYYLSGKQGTVSYISIGNSQYRFDAIMNDDFDMSVFKDKQLHVHYIYGNFSSDSRIINNVDSAFSEQDKDGKGFFERWEYLKNSSFKRKLQLKSNIEELKDKKKSINSLKIKSLIKEYGVEAVLSDKVRDNKLLVFLLRNGYIDETYSSYINYFHPNSITKEEMNFILSIRNYEKVADYSYRLDNCEQIVKRLLEYEFEQKEVLNFDLLDYLLKECKNDNKCIKFIEQLSDGSDICNDFIKQYIDRGNNIPEFIKSTAKQNPLLWLDIYEDIIISDEQKYTYFILIIKYADKEDIIRNNRVINQESGVENPISNFILENSDILIKLSSVDEAKLKYLIDTLEIEFSELICEGVSKELLDFIYENDYYKINLEMLENIIGLRDPEKVGELLIANYTTIRELQYQPLLEYIDDNFIEYIKNIVLSVETNENESLETVLCIIDKLIDEPDLCNELIKKEKITLESFNDCFIDRIEQSTELKSSINKIWNQILSENKVVASWENIHLYWDKFYLTGELNSFIESNMDKLLQDDETDFVNDVLIKSIIVEDMNIIEYKKFITKFRPIEFTNKISEFTKSQVEVMLECSYFDITPDRFYEMRESYPELCIEYIIRNKDRFLTELEQYSLNIPEVEELIGLHEFDETEKLEIIIMQDINVMTERIALCIKDLKIDIETEIIEKAWNILSEENRYELLINHITNYTLNELEEKFKELGTVYLQLTDRTKKHKVTLENTEFNNRLMHYLESVGYLSSVASEIRDSIDDITHKKKRITNVVGWIKKV